MPGAERIEERQRHRHAGGAKQGPAAKVHLETEASLIIEMGSIHS
jgi:hypothetical protein